MKRYAVLGALIVAAALAWRANAIPNLGDAYTEAKGVALSYAENWVDSTGVSWSYDKTSNLWVAPGPLIMFAKTGAWAGGPLGFYSATGTACDTTTGATIGISYPESLYVVGYRWYNKEGVAANDTVQIFTNSTLFSQADWGTAVSGVKWGVNLFVGPNVNFSGLTKTKAAGPVHPTTPIIIVETRRFRRPA